MTPSCQARVGHHERSRAVVDQRGPKMGQIFSWLWDHKEPVPPLRAVTAENQVSLNPPPDFEDLLSVSRVCASEATGVGLNIWYQLAPSQNPLQPLTLVSLVNSLFLPITLPSLPPLVPLRLPFLWPPSFTSVFAPPQLDR